MIRIKPEQNVTKRKAGIFRVHHLFQSSVFHIILSVCVCVCVCVHVCTRARALWICQCHQFIFVVALHFGLFYLTNYKRAVVVVVFFCLTNVFPCVCVCVWAWSFCIADVFYIVGSVPLYFCPCVFCVVSYFEDEFGPFSMWGLFK